MAYSSDAMRACYDAVEAAMPSAQLSGIYTDKPGYHNCRNKLPSSDYSVQRSWDKKGDAGAGGGIDITLSDSDIKKTTQRLIDETKRTGDSGPLRALNEFFGTTNGNTVTGMDVPGQYWVTSDDSHLWHNHLSGKRQYADDMAAWLDVAAVMTGGATGSTPEEDDDVPKQYKWSGFTAKTIKGGTWNNLSWSKYDDPKSSGTSACIGGCYYVATLDVSVESLPDADNLSLRFVTVDAKTLEDNGASATTESRGTSGGTGATLTRAAYVPNGSNLRAQVNATRDVKITNASWSVLLWPA